MNVGAVTIPIGLTVATLTRQVNTATNLINGLIGPANNVQAAVSNLFSAGGLNNFNFLRADLIFWAKMTKELIVGNSVLKTVLGNIALPSSLTQGLTTALSQLTAVNTQLQTQLAGFTTLSSQIIESASSLSMGQGINPIMGPGMQMGPSVTTMLDVSQGVEEYVGFEKIANSFRAMAIAGGESTESINAVMEETKRLGAVTSKTPTAVVGLAGELSKLGFTSESVSKSLEGITKTSEATGEDLTKVGSVVAVALNSFKIPSEKTSLVSDKMASIANASATSILSIGESMKYVGTSAYNANQSLDTTLVALGLLSNAGIEGSAAGTGLSVAIVNLQKAAASAKGSLVELNAETAKLTKADLENLMTGSQEGDAVFSGSIDTKGSDSLRVKALNALGLDKSSLLDAEGNLKQLTDIIPVIKDKIEQLKTTTEGTSNVPILINALFGVQGGRTIQALLGQTEADIARLMQSANTAEGFSSKVSQVMLGGLSGSIEQLAGSVQTVSLIVGEFYAPAFKIMVDATLSVVNAFASLPVPIRNFAFSLSVIVPLIILYWKSIAATKSIMEAYTAITIGLSLAKTALGRAELVLIVTQSISEAKTRILIGLYTAQLFILDVLTGTTSLQSAANILLSKSIQLATTAYSVNTSTLRYAIQVTSECVTGVSSLIVKIGLWITSLDVGKIAVKAWGVATYVATNLISVSVSSVKALMGGIYSLTASIIANIQARTLANAVNKAETVAETAHIIATNARTLADLGLLSVTKANTLASIAKNRQLIFELLNTQLISAFTARFVIVNKLQLAVTWANVLALKAKILVLHATIAAQNIYALVTGRATTANLGFIASTTVLIARFAIIAAAAWAVSQAWNSFSSGMKEANTIKETANDINKLTKEFTGLQIKANESADIFEKFWAKVQQKGPIEAVQAGITKLGGGNPNDMYGEGDGPQLHTLTTNSQLAAQRAMFATAEVSKAVNAQLDLGIGVMQKYGVETFEAADKQRLGAKGIADFKAEAKGQVEMLSKTLEALKAQQPVNDEQKAFIQTNIKLTEQQIKILRGKIVALESETSATKVHILTLDELTQKYKNVAHASELANLTAAASIEEAAAKGKNNKGISQEEKNKRLSVLGKTEINERVQSNDNKLKDLRAASVGATEEDATKIAEEIKKIEIDQVKARIDSAKYEQQVRKNLNDDLLASNKELEDSVTAKQELSSQNQITAIKKAQAARTYSAEEAATKIATIESTNLQTSIARETQKQQELNRLRQWGVISEEEARKGVRESAITIAKTQGQLAEAELKKSEERISVQVKKIKEETKIDSEKMLAGLDAKSFTNDQQGKLAGAQSGVSDARSELDKQRLGFALQLAELNNNQSQQEQVKNQIYQQQLVSLTQQQQAKRQELVVSQQQAAIELERKRVQSEIAVLEAQSALQVAQTQGASDGEIATLQQSIALKQQVVAQVATEKTNQQKLNSLTAEQLTIQQQTAKEGIEQQRQIDLQRQAIEKKTKAIEEGINRARALSETQLQGLDFKGQDIGTEISQQKLLTDISQSQSNLQKQRIEFSLQLAELTGNEASKEQIKQQIYQQQLTSMAARYEAQKTSIELSNQQATIELERKRIQGEISLLEAEANLRTAEAKNASAAEVESLQSVLNLRQKSIAYISTEEANQSKINQLTSQHLSIEQQIAREGLEQQHQIELERQAIERKTKAIEDGLTKAKNLSEAQSQKLEFKGQDIGAEIGKQKLLADISQSQASLQKQRLEFSLQTAEVTGNEVNKELLRQQIYQQQQASLVAQHQAQRTSLELSNEQAKIELERKRIQNEIALIEAQASLASAQTKHLSDEEIDSLQAVISLREKSIAYISTEEANQSKINQLAGQHLVVEQQITKEGLEQQRQIDLQRQAIEKKTKAIEDGLTKAKNLSEAQSQKLEFKGQDIGTEISKQKLLADISQSQTSLQKQRLEFSLQTAELTGDDASKEQIKQQIYQQQQSSLVAQHQAQRTSLELSIQQAKIELERKRIQNEIALIEAQASLASAQAKNLSDVEIDSLQAVVSLREKSIAYIATEEANQSKINQLTSQHLSIEQQIAREGLEQQRQLEMQKLAIEKRTKAIEDGLIRARTVMEGKSQNLEFEGQDIGAEINKQKGITDLQQSQSALQKQQLDFALQRAELTGNESAKEQIKEQIYQQQKEALIAQQQAQIVGIGLSRQQATIELERQKLSAQIALTEAQANLAKAQVTKGSSGAEIESLRAAIGLRQQALGQIDVQAKVGKQIQSTEDQRLAIERQTTMENMVQTRELERQREAIEKQKKAIEERLQVQKSGLENRQGKLELSSQLLDLESRQLSARSGLTEAVNGLEQQRLEFLMSQAEITNNTAQKEGLKTQLYQQQLVALYRSQQAQQQSFEISQKQKQIELDKQEIQAKIATFEAEANIAKAKADNGSAQQISALEAVHKLRQDGLNQVGKMRTAEGQIANLERQKLGFEQLSAREKLQQTNQLEKMRQVYEANNKAIEKTNSLEKERNQQSSDTSGGLSWVDKAGPAWFENAKNSFQKAADDYLATPVTPVALITPDKPKSDLLAQQGKTPDTPQQLANMQIAAQNVYLTGTIAENKPAVDGVNAGAIPLIPATGVDADIQREAAKAKIEQAQNALSEAIARANAQKPNIDPQEATRQGAVAGQAAREYAAQIRADLKSGVLKNEVTGKTVALNLPPSLAELAANLTTAQAALKEIKDPVTMESIYKLMGEIKTILSNQSMGNLTVVSQNPVADCGEILSALTKRR